jgi:hypothetical protein
VKSEATNRKLTLPLTENSRKWKKSVRPGKIREEERCNRKRKKRERRQQNYPLKK